MTEDRMMELFEQERLKSHAKSRMTFVRDNSQVTFLITELLFEWTKRVPVSARSSWMSLLELFAGRLAWLSSSLENLAEGTVYAKYAGHPRHVLDLSGVHALARTQLEAYLTFFNLFVQPASEEERDLRVAIYRLQSLTVRAENGTVRSQELDAKRNQNQEQIEKVHAQLKANKIFASYHKDLRTSILKGRYSKRKGWTELIEESKLNNEIMKVAYALYANHAHSEYISIVQFREGFSDPEALEELVSNAVRQSVFMLSVFLRELAVLLNAEDFYNKIDEELRFKLRLWAGIITGSHESTTTIDL